MTQKFFGIVAVIHTLLVLAQPVLAGMSLQGSGLALDLHAWNALSIITVAAIQVLAALLWRKPGGGPASALGVSGFLLVAEVIQYMIGDGGLFALHLPLGIIVLFGALAAAGMAFHRRPESADQR